MNIIDRRLNPRDKNLTNRQRFVTRAKAQIKRAVADAISSGNITDIDDGKVKVPIKDSKEPIFSHDPQTGHRRFVAPGNKEFVEGDRIAKPSEDDGSGGKGSPDGEGDDEFQFTLTKAEFLSFFFDDLELPDLVKKQIGDITKAVPKRAGYTSVGNPAQLDIRLTLRNAMGRRLALHRPKQSEIEELEQQLALLEDCSEDYQALSERIAKEKRRSKAVPWIDPFDVRFRNFVLQPTPITRSVMVCLMDVSGSMGEREKDIAKRFFMLLYMFLSRKYENVDIVFVRHHSTAEECNEHDFFYKRETGGTVVSSGLQVVHDIIRKRYPLDSWNIYVAQASDGDNYGGDEDDTRVEMHRLLPLVQYFAYLDIPREMGMLGIIVPSEVWKLYYELSKSFSHLALKQAVHQRAIWGVFKELFSPQNIAALT